MYVQVMMIKYSKFCRTHQTYFPDIAKGVWIFKNINEFNSIKMCNSCVQYVNNSFNIQQNLWMSGWQITSDLSNQWRPCEDGLGNIFHERWRRHDSIRGLDGTCWGQDAAYEWCHFVSVFLKFVKKKRI